MTSVVDHAAVDVDLTTQPADPTSTSVEERPSPAPAQPSASTSGKDGSSSKRKAEQADQPSSSKKAKTVSRETKRQNVFRSVSKGERCGYCKSCLNPKMKQACFTIREQMERLKDQDDADENAKRLFAKVIIHKKKGALASATSLEKKSPLESFLNGVLDAKGGLIAEKAGVFAKFMGKETRKTGMQYQTLCLRIIQKSSWESQKNLIESGGLKAVYDWLSYDLEHKYNKLVKMILQTSQLLPISKAMTTGAKQPSGVKQLIIKIKELKKHKDEEVAILAKKTHATLKEKVTASDAKPEKPSAAVKKASPPPKDESGQKGKAIQLDDSQMFKSLDKAVKSAKQAPASVAQASTSSTKQDDPSGTRKKAVTTVAGQGRSLGQVSASNQKLAKELGGQRVLAPSEMKPKKSRKKITWKDEVFKHANLCEFHYIPSRTRARSEEASRRAEEMELQRKKEREDEKRKIENINRMKQEEAEKQVKEKMSIKQELEQAASETKWKPPMRLKGIKKIEVTSGEFRVQSERIKNIPKYDPKRDGLRESPTEPAKPQIPTNLQNQLKSLLGNTALLNNINQITSSSGSAGQPTNPRATSQQTPLMPTSSPGFGVLSQPPHTLSMQHSGPVQMQMYQPMASMGGLQQPMSSMAPQAGMQQPGRSFIPISSMGMSMPMNVMQPGVSTNLRYPLQNQNAIPFSGLGNMAQQPNPVHGVAPPNPPVMGWQERRYK